MVLSRPMHRTLHIAQERKQVAKPHQPTSPERFLFGISIRRPPFCVLSFSRLCSASCAWPRLCIRFWQSVVPQLVSQLSSSESVWPCTLQAHHQPLIHPRHTGELSLKTNCLLRLGSKGGIQIQSNSTLFIIQPIPHASLVMPSGRMLPPRFSLLGAAPQESNWTTPPQCSVNGSHPALFNILIAHCSSGSL